MSKFHNYSANNIQLIEMQCPDATYVAGYKAWQKNFERHVNKGERGIRILAPAPYKIKEEQEKIDPVTNEPVLDRDGMPVMEEVEIKIPAFHVVTVFDYSQTDGKELPGLGVSELHGNVERYDTLPEAIAKFSEYRGKDVEDKPDMARATLGVSVNGIKLDVIHVRNHENCLSLDFTHSKPIEENSQFLDDLQVLYNEVGFDKVRVHREMSPEEIKDFVKQRFEYQLKGSGLDDISLYMDRFDALYGQGKIEHLMPTANQKHIVEDVPFMEWENPYIDTSSHTTDRMETELAFRLADRYVSIQEASEGYDYTIYDILFVS